jgi:hypothetical protein
LSSNECRNIEVLYTHHHFDIESAKLVLQVALHQPEILLLKYSLLQPIRQIMQQVQPHIAFIAANMLIRYLEPSYLQRLVESTLTPDVKFKVALSQLKQHQPKLAELLTFQLHELNRFSAIRPLHIDAYDFDDLSNILNQESVRDLAVAGEMFQLPVWLEGLPCTSTVNEAASLEVTCTAQTKVYKLCLDVSSFPQPLTRTLKYEPALAGPTWNIETCDSLFSRYGRTANCLVCSKVLGPGSYKLDSTDAIYFFDTHRHVKHQFLRTSVVSLCKFMQRNGQCYEGDCCNYSHAPPRYFSPEISVYISNMMFHCQRNIRVALHQVAEVQIPLQLRLHLYSKINKHSYFAARRRVFSAGLVTKLILRLLCSNLLTFPVAHLAACVWLPKKIYSRLALKEKNDFDDDDTETFIEREGYRFRTLFKRKHSRHIYVRNSLALCHIGDEKCSESGFRMIPKGWEICPPDDISIAVCMQYLWQSHSIALRDRKKYATLGCSCDECIKRDLSQQPRVPHTSGFANIRIEGCNIEVQGVDILLRRRICAQPTSVSMKPTEGRRTSGASAAAQMTNHDVRELANFLARCSLARANLHEKERILNFLDRNQ